MLVEQVATAAMAIACDTNPLVGEVPSKKVQLRRTRSGWEMLRAGEPYFIRGAGGDGSRELLARSGGNSIRTWGADDLQSKLDEAQRLGLMVAVGIWLGHERHGFDYGDAEQVARQYETVRETILRYKDHPAVLLWGLGNEMEGYGQGDNVTIWKVVNDLAVLAKRLDPDHPTMTVVAEIGGDRVANVHRLVPGHRHRRDQQLCGGGLAAATLPRGGRDKPYILTEFGPPGPWEIRQDRIGARPIEPSSSGKAFAYRRSYEKAVAAAPGLCLGSYAFLWGHKQEATATWFGMLLPDGDRLGAGGRPRRRSGRGSHRKTAARTSSL